VEQEKSQVSASISFLSSYFLLLQSYWPSRHTPHSQPNDDGVYRYANNYSRDVTTIIDNDTTTEDYVPVQIHFIEISRGPISSQHFSASFRVCVREPLLQLLVLHSTHLIDSDLLPYHYGPNAFSLLVGQFAFRWNSVARDAHEGNTGAQKHHD
jgi:hypothetical protein